MPVCLLFLLGFALAYGYPFLAAKIFMRHQEYIYYYHPHRIWFLEQIRQGNFPEWNASWGVGSTSEITSTFPIDIYSLLEIAFGPQYHVFEVIQFASIVVAALFAFRSLGFAPWIATAGAIFYFLSPLVNFYAFYFMKPNSFVAALACFALSYHWFRTGNRKFLFAFSVVTALSLFGTKLEFWFFQATFFSLIALLARPRKRALPLLGALALGLLCHLWQIIPLVQILEQTGRLSTTSGWHHLFSLELYRKLGASIVDSAFLWTLSLSFLSLHAIRCRSLQNLAFVVAGYLLFLTVGPWRDSPFYFLNNAYAIGALLALIFGLWRHRWDFKKTLETLALFLPVSYYWLRPLASDVSEVHYLQNIPPSLVQAMIGGFTLFGVSRWRQSRLVRLSYAMLAALFVVRDQGQILLSYLKGMVWIPTRDNYLFEILLAIFMMAGLQKCVKSARTPTMATILLFLASFFPYYYRSNKLITAAPANFPEYEGNPFLRKVLREKKEEWGPTWRGFFNPKDFDALLIFGSALTENVGQVLAYSSLPDQRYRKWAHYHQWGISPDNPLESHAGDYTDKTIQKLAPRNLLGWTNERAYPTLVFHYPKLDASVLQILGVRHVFWVPGQTIPRHPAWGKSRIEGDNYFAVLDLNGGLPRAFTLPKLSDQGESIFAEALAPKVDGSFLVVDKFRWPYREAAITKYEHEKVTIEVDVKEESDAILTDLFHPFWKATLDGKETPISPALYLFRRVRVPAGKHTIEFVCSIPFFWTAMGASIFFAIVMMAFGLWCFRPKIPKLYWHPVPQGV